MSDGDAAAATPQPWYADLTPKHWRVLTSSFLGWIFDGYEALALVVVIAPLMHTVLTPAQAASTPVYAGLVIGITLLGWGVGGMVGGVLADYVGRKRMMLWSVFLYAVFSGLTAFADTFWVLGALRFLTGLAMGSEWSTGVALLSETWPERARAKGAGFLQSGFGWGTMIAAVVWYVLSSTHPLGEQSWRLMFVLGAVPALFVLYIRRGVDESEKWQTAVRQKRWQAVAADAPVAAGGAAVSARRPFTLAQLFGEPEALRRMLLTLLLSIVTTVGWWAIQLAADLHGGDCARARAGRCAGLGFAHVHHLYCRCYHGLYGGGFYCRCHRPARLFVPDLPGLVRDYSDHVQVHAHHRGHGVDCTDQRFLHAGLCVCVDGHLPVRVVHLHRALECDQLCVQRGALDRVGVSHHRGLDDQVLRWRVASGAGAGVGVCDRHDRAVVPARNQWAWDAGLKRNRG
jgi:MFS family permease